MLTHHRLPVCLSLISTDLPILSTIETAATLYQQEQGRFHLYTASIAGSRCGSQSRRCNARPAPIALVRNFGQSGYFDLTGQ
jgi:hypothetical protein